MRKRSGLFAKKPNACTATGDEKNKAQLLKGAFHFD
jgi:hypothetical protein